QAIQEVWQGIFDAGLTAFRVESLEVESAGDLAYEMGRYTLYAGDNDAADAGKYIRIWKREAGQWRIHRDIVNSSRPAEGATTGVTYTSPRFTWKPPDQRS